MNEVRANAHPYVPANDDRFRTIFDAVKDGIFISDPATGRFIEINGAGYAMFGYSDGELVDADIGTLSSGVHPYTADVAFEKGERARLGEAQTFEWRCKTKAGALMWVEIAVRYTEFGATPAIVAVVRDISERKRLDARIIYLAEHDELTGLANRARFSVELDETLELSRRTGKRFSILLLDLDRFKDVNDTLGHPIGDQLLRLAALRVRECVRDTDRVARLGGDEFAILITEARAPAEIAGLAKRLIASISRPFSVQGNRIYVGVSIGVAVYSDRAANAEALISQADMALYRAKADGRQTCRFYSEAMSVEVRSRVQTTGELRAGIAAGQLFLVYQPQVTAKDGKIIGVEALVRWRHPQRGVMAPAEFLPVAESSGLVASLDQWVLREACRQGRQWFDAGITSMRISVNLSSAQVRDPLAFEQLVFNVLWETRLPPHLLELEIMESTLVSNLPQHAEMIQRLRSAGIRFSLDDFGTGYSSLNYLRRFSIDRIKIAREFIAELTTSAEAASIVRLILGMSSDFGSEVIAEGVETPEQLRMLQDWDCKEIQGFYFAAPMSPAAIAPLLRVGRIERNEPPSVVAASDLTAVSSAFGQRA